MRRTWRCFFCDEVFTKFVAAAEHFGCDQACEPVCKISGSEAGLVGYIRDLEKLLSTYRNESDPITRAWHAREDDHRRALIREEERGYARGLRDALDAQGVKL